MLKRNTSGLQSHVQKKRESAQKRTEAAIQKLLIENRPVNFDAVAKEAGVSRTWLYQQADIRERIEDLREKQAATVTPRKESTKALPPATTAFESSASPGVQQRIKKLETENLVLRKHLEVVYGLSDANLIKVIELLQLENEELKVRLQQIQNLLIWDSPEIITNQLREQIQSEELKRTEEIKQLRADLESKQRELRECRAIRTTSQPKLADIEQKRKQQKTTNTDGEISEELKDKFSEVGIKLNTELIEMIKSRPYEQVINALSVLKESLALGKVRSKAGLFRKALEKAWSPNEPDSEREASAIKTAEAEWYDLARNQGIVIARREEDGVLMVQENTGQWHKFEDFSSKWTLDYLRRCRNRNSK